MGWSNGGTAVLNAFKADAPGRLEDEPRFRAAVAYFPGCLAFSRRALKPATPLLIEAGAANHWTPARHCEALVRETARVRLPIEIDIYPDAHHGFDRIGLKLQPRPGVRNPNSKSGWGATVGEQPEPRARSIVRVTDWLGQANR